MVTDSTVHKAAVKNALDNINLDYRGGDTGLEVESNIVDGQWVQLTSMRDGLPRPPIPRVHASRVLEKTLPDGSPAFWIQGMPYDPPVPQIGSIKCYFHPEFDETDGPAGFGRDFIDQAGLEGFTCNNKDNSKQNRGDFKTVMQRDAHMQNRHRRQIEAVEKAQGDAKEQAERSERRQQTETMMRLMERQIELSGGVVPEAPEPAAVPLEYLNAEGLRSLAVLKGVKLRDARSAEKMREDIEAAEGG